MTSLPRPQLHFERNQGQTDPQVQYMARGADSIVFLTRDGAVLETAATVCAEADCRLRRPSGQRGVVRLQFAGGAPASIEGVAPAAAVVNDYTDGRRLSGLATYGAVQYRGIYAGIDLRFYGHDGALEYDFAVQPEADTNRIALQFSGARPILTTAGDLRFNVPGGPVFMHRPVAYQLVNGRPEAVSASYVERANGSIGLALGQYDRGRPLVIDPVLTFATYLGGTTEYSAVNGIAVDSSGAAYVTGATLDSNFPTTSGAPQTTNAGSFDIFITKLATNGTSLTYSTYLGGSGQDEGNAIAVDGSGNAYVAGDSLSSNFPVTTGSYQGTATNGDTPVVAKLTAAGALGWATYLGGSGEAKGIAVDSSGNVIVDGFTASSSFPTTSGAPQTALAGKTNAFVTSLNSSGTSLNWSTYLGGSSVDEANALALDASGDAFVAGYTSSSNFPVSAAPFQNTLGGVNDAFVAKVDRSGKTIDYSTYLGGSLDDEANGIAVDAAGHAYVTGQTSSINFPVTPTSYHPSSSGGEDIFVAELSINGSSLVYSTYVGGSAADYGTGIVVDPSGSAYVTGSTASKDFPVTSNATQITFGGNTDAFLIKLDPIGANLLFATYLGGSGIDTGTSMAIDSGGDIYIGGVTASGNFPTTSGVFQPAAPETTAGFVVKFNTAPQAVFTPSALGFTAEAVKVASTAEAVTLTNGGEETLDISGISTTGPFTETNTCGATLVPQANCTINVVFTPTAIGNASGSIVISDNSASGKDTLALTGVGGNFTLSVAPTTNTITAGSSASYTVTVTPAAGYTNIINFTCTGIPTGATCTPSPTSLTMNGTSASLTTYTITTNASTTALPPWGSGRGPWIWLLVALGSLLWFGAARYWRARTGTEHLWRAPFWAGAVLVAALGLAAAGCGGNADTTVGTPPGNYTLTFTGTDATTSSVTQSITVTLTVD